ncbi:MAG: hypothetical protein FJ299_09580 [Planctomycetes bacterium]|nr:hypothetical protein [Planctomycetota bacterium]
MPTCLRFCSVRALARVALFLVAACGAGLARPSAQAPAGEPAAISNEQKLLEHQLQRLEKTMRNLRDRLATEGRPRALELLDQGLALLAERDAALGGLTLGELMSESTRRAAESELARALEHQEAVVSRLDALLALLLDRASLDKLEQRAADAAALARDLETLSNEQRELRDQAQQAAQQALGPQGQELAAELEELAREQRKLLEAGLARARADGSLEREQLQAALQALQRAQATDHQVLQSRDPARAAELDAALAELRTAGDPAQARQRLEALRDGGASPDAPQPPDARSAGDPIAKAAERALQALAENQDAEAGLEAARDALRAAASEQARLVPMLRASQTAQARSARALAQQAASSNALEQRERERAAAELAQAATHMERAGEALREGDAQAGTQAAAEAEQALARAAEAMGQAAQKGAAAQAGADQSSRQAAQQAAQQAALEQRAQAAAAQARQAQPSGNSAPPTGADSEPSAAQALEQAQQAMQEAGAALQEQRAQSAAAAQDRAATALDEARRRLSEQARPRDAEQQARAEQLAREQQELERRMLELAERMRDDAHARKAAQHAEQAAGALRAGRPQQGAEEAEQARQELEQAREEVRAEERRYEQLRQEELLFRMADEVAKLVLRQRAQLEETRELHSERAGAATPSRAQKIRLRKISAEEAQLGKKAGELAEALAAEQSLVFAEALADVRLDLLDLASRLGEEGDWDSGEFVQGLQQQVEERLGWLQQSLATERDRRRNESEQGNPPSTEEQQKERLIPDVAELKLLRQLELDNASQIERLVRRYPELAQAGSPDPLVLREIQRLATRHERVTVLFGILRARLNLPDPDDLPAVSEDSTNEEPR